jgi:hypothetical protein
MARKASGRMEKYDRGLENVRDIAGYRVIKMDIGGLNRIKLRKRWA